MNKIAIVFLFTIALTSCSPKVNTNIQYKKNPLPENAEVHVFGVADGLPQGSKLLGTFSITDNGMATKCRYNYTIQEAKKQARLVGGNAIKLTDVINHSLQSNCDQLFGKIVFVPDFTKPVIENNYTLKGKDYALIHFYRPSGAGFLVGYKIRINDTIVARTRDNWKRNIRIYREGVTTFRSATEAKSILKVDIKKGHEYYIVATLHTGIMIGQPKLRLVDYEVGKNEFDAINDKYLDNRDKLFLNDGKIINCAILKETDDKYYFVMETRNGKVITEINKNRVKNIERDLFQVKK